MPITVICALTVIVMAVLLAATWWTSDDARPVDVHTCPQCGRDRRSIEAELCARDPRCSHHRRKP